MKIIKKETEVEKLFNKLKGKHVVYHDIKGRIVDFCKNSNYNQAHLILITDDNIRGLMSYCDAKLSFKLERNNQIYDYERCYIISINNKKNIKIIE